MSSVPADIATRNFRDLGVLWRVRKRIGLTYEFSDLASLRAHMEDGQVDPQDMLSPDNKEWVPLQDIPDLDAHFWDVWQKAEKGQIAKTVSSTDEDDEDPTDSPTTLVAGPDYAPSSEDEQDAPTTLMGEGSALAEEIRRAVKGEQSEPDHSTNPGAPARSRVTDPFTRLERSEQDSQSASPVQVGLTIGVPLVVLLVILAWVGGVLDMAPDVAPEGQAVPTDAAEEMPPEPSD